MKKIKKWLFLALSIFAFALVSMFQSVPNNTLKFLKINQSEKKQLNDFEAFNYNLFYVENHTFIFKNGSYIELRNGVFNFYGNFSNGVSFKIDLINEFNYDECYLLFNSNLNYSNGNSYYFEFETGDLTGYCDTYFNSTSGSVEPFKEISIRFDCNYTLNGEKIYVSLSSVKLSKYEPNLNYLYNEGYNDGYNTGEENGYDNGYDEGYNDGYDTGEDDGYNKGYDIGEDNGYNHGYDVGYEDGYKNGLIEDNANIYSIYSDLYYGVTEGDSMPNLKNYKFSTPYYSSGFEITKNSISPTQLMFESVEVAIESGSQKNNFFVLDFIKSCGFNVN